MFRDKESSNRIELSRLVQDLLNFRVWASCSWGGWGGWVDGGGGGWVDGGGGGWGAFTHMYMHMHTHTHTHTHTCMCGKHDNFMQMVASIGFLGNPWEFPMMSHVHTCACMYVHVHMCGGTLSPPPPHPPTPTPGGTPGISQNSIVLELIKIFQFSLKI